MAAPIIHHQASEDPEDDAAHPIPSLSVIDVTIVKKGGGADLVIVIASPLQADEQSLDRLRAKIVRYASFITSPEFQAQSGNPNPTNTAIVVAMHPDSDPLAFDLVRRCEDFATAHHSSIRVEPLSAYLLHGTCN